MTAILEAVRDKPVALFGMDDSAPFQDYSGFNVAGTMSTGTPGKATALMAGATYSTVFNAGAVGAFPSSVFKQGNEDKPFSLEAWVYVIATGNDDDIKILSNSGVTDGLTVNGTRFSFGTVYASTGSAVASFDIQVNRRVHIVGVHTENQNLLFVDGLLVSEVEISEEQKADIYAAPGGTLYSGQSAFSRSIAVNGLGIYATALSAEQVARHFAIGNRHVPREAMPSQFAGTRIALSQNEADVFLEQTWTTQYDWTTASLTDVVVEDDRLKPRLSDGVSVAGTWLDVFALDAAGTTSIYGVNMLWDGEGAIVEASLDGVTWEQAVRGQNLDLIPAGFDPTNKDLHLRISFPGGITEDTSFVDNLTVTGFKSGAVPTIANRTITTDGYVRNDYEPVELRDDWGVALPSGTAVTISADASPDAVAPKTIEVWGKGTFTTNITATGTRSNGGASYAPTAGEWQMRTYTVPAGHTGDIVITATGTGATIGQVMLYSDQLDNTQIAEIYSAYVGLPKVTADDAAMLTITEPDTAANIYAYDWSISASG